MNTSGTRTPRRAAAWRPTATVAVLVAGVALLGTACGSVAAPQSVGQTSGASAASQPPAAASAAQWTAGRARSYARQLAAQLRLPPGSSVTPWPPKPARLIRLSLLTPPLSAVLSDVVDVRLVYRVPLSMSALSRYLTRHRPAGLKLVSTGSAGQAQRSSAPGTPPPPLRGVEARYASFTPRTLPAGLYLATVATAAVPASGSGSLLRADAQVAWYPPRSAAEHVTASAYHSVTVTWPALGAAGPVRRTVTERTIIDRLAAVANGLHAAPSVVTGCPLMRGTSYRVVFSPAAPGAPAIAIAPTGCLIASVTAGGQRQPSLYPAATLIAALRRLPR